MLVVGDSILSRSYYYVITANLPRMHEEFFGRAMDGENRFRLFTLGRTGIHKPYGGKLPVTRLPMDAPWPTLGVLLPSVGQRSKLTLRVTPMAIPDGTPDSDWSCDLLAGSSVEIFKPHRTST